MHPGAWLVWVGAAGLAAMSTTNPFYLAPLMAAAWVVAASRGRSGAGARSFSFFAGFAALAVVVRTLLVFVAPSDVDASVVAAAFLEGLRLAAMLLVYGAFNAASDPFRLLRLAPRRFHEPALAAALALSIAPRTIAAAAQVREAQRMRGIHPGRLRSLPALAVPVLETGMEEAVTLAESMDARGHGRGRRSRYRAEPWEAPSWMVAGGALACVAVFGLAAVASHGGLVPSTFPLAWPEAAPHLVAAAAGFALPGLLPGDKGDREEDRDGVPYRPDDRARPGSDRLGDRGRKRERR